MTIYPYGKVDARILVDLPMADTITDSVVIHMRKIQHEDFACLIRLVRTTLEKILKMSNSAYNHHWESRKSVYIIMTEI
jgi:hypothetical protein